MIEQLKERALKVKTKWTELPKKKKIIIGGSAGGVLLIALLVTFLLNRPADKMVLFPDMSSNETREVYGILQEKGIPAEIDKEGQVRVPSDIWNDVVFEMATAGYPTSAPNYDFYLGNSGWTKSEFEQKQVLKMQSEDRMRQILEGVAGIESADVTFSIPETSNYIWDQNNREPSTAAITIKMRKGEELTPERVQGIKNLASVSIPNLSPDHVVVVDAATGIEMQAADDEAIGSYNTKRLEFEREIAKNIENNIRRILTPRYGADGVHVVAQVSVDYSKIKTEQKQLQPEDNGKGIITHFEENFTQNGDLAAEGLVGEENNTDVPKYPNQVGDGDGNTSDYSNSIDYDISYVLTQMEKGEPVLEKATAGVVVNDANFTEEKRDDLVNLISKSTNIPAENISVTNLNYEDPTLPSAGNDISTSAALNWWLVGGLSGLVLIVFIIFLVIFLLRRRKKNKALAAAKALEEAERERQQQLEREIMEHKMMLQNEALASTNAKEDAIVQEVRDFAEQNPEVTANLLRSLLREEE